MYNVQRIRGSTSPPVCKRRLAGRASRSRRQRLDGCAPPRFASLHMDSATDFCNLESNFEITFARHSSGLPQQFAIWPLFIGGGVLGEPALPCGFPVLRDLRGRARSPSAPHSGALAPFHTAGAEPRAPGLCVKTIFFSSFVANVVDPIFTARDRDSGQHTAPTLSRLHMIVH